MILLYPVFSNNLRTSESSTKEDGTPSAISQLPEASNGVFVPAEEAENSSCHVGTSSDADDDKNFHKWTVVTKCVGHFFHEFR